MASAADIEKIIAALPYGGQIISYVNAKLAELKTTVEDDAKQGVYAAISENQGYVFAAGGAILLALVLSLRTTMALRRPRQLGAPRTRRLPPSRRFR